MKMCLANWTFRSCDLCVPQDLFFHEPQANVAVTGSLIHMTSLKGLTRNYRPETTDQKLQTSVLEARVDLDGTDRAAR